MHLLSKKFFVTYAFSPIFILLHRFNKTFMQMRDKLFLMWTGDKVRRVYSMGAIAWRVDGFYSRSIFVHFSRHVASTTTRCVYRSSVYYYERISPAKCTHLAPLNFPQGKSLPWEERKRKSIKYATDMIVLQLILHSFFNPFIYIFKYFYLSIVGERLIQLLYLFKKNKFRIGGWSHLLSQD